MADHRVDDLRLHLRTTSGLPGEVRGPVERFIADILEAVGDRLEARWPSRLVFLRQLHLRWKIADDELADPSVIPRYAEEIAASFGDPQPQRPGEHVPEGDVVIFRDEVNWWACYLAARGTGDAEASAWAYDGLRARGIDFTSLAARGREFALAVLAGLAEAGRLVRVVRAADHTALATVATVLGAAPPGSGSPARVAGDPALLRAARSLPSGLPRPAVWLILYVDAMQTLGPSAVPEEIARLTDRAVDELTPPDADSRELRHRDDGAPAETASGPRTEWDTEFGGLFYLLSIALELDVGETLWKACLPEQLVLAHTAAAFLGDSGSYDPAVVLFGGLPALAPLEVSPQQQEEVAAALTGSVAAALPRRSLARLPELLLRLSPVAGTPALVASEPDSPFALFVWPGADPRRVEKGLRVFLAAWPPSAPRLLGTPSIAEWEGGVRVSAAPSARKSPGPFTIDAGSAPACALIAQIVGALGHTFAARAGLDPVPTPATLIDRYFALRARLVIGPKEMTVVVPMAHIDPDLRRSGLDRDPGWIPWLGRTVRFVFAE